MKDWRNWFIILMAFWSGFVFWIAIPSDEQIIQDWKQQRFYASKEVLSLIKDVKNEVMDYHAESLHQEIIPSCFTGQKTQASQTRNRL